MFSLLWAAEAGQGSPAGLGHGVSRPRTAGQHGDQGPPAEQEKPQEAERDHDERGRGALAGHDPQHHADDDRAEPRAEAGRHDRLGPPPRARHQQARPEAGQERPGHGGQAASGFAVVVAGPPDGDEGQHAAHVEDRARQPPAAPRPGLAAGPDNGRFLAHALRLTGPAAAGAGSAMLRRNAPLADRAPHAVPGDAGHVRGRHEPERETRRSRASRS